MPRLTKRLIDATPPPAQGDVILWDDQIPGFGCRLWPSGRKVFFIRVRRGGKNLRVPLGQYGVCTVDQARKLATDALYAVRLGKDPRLPSATPTGPTVQEVADRYLREHATPKNKPRSVKGDRDMFRLHILPAFGKRPLAEITTEDLATLHHTMRRTPHQANRMLGLMSSLCRRAEFWGLRPRGSNPAVGIARYPELSRDRFLSLEEIARLGQVMHEAEALQTVHPSVIACIRLLLLTGCRLGEILSLPWKVINLQEGVARLEDSKTGRRTVHLSKEAVTLLEGLPSRGTSEWVLPGHIKGTHLQSPKRAWHRFRAQAQLENIRLHDLRHTWATHALRQKVPLPIIAFALGHTQLATTTRYLHEDMEQVAAAVQQVSTPVAQALMSR